MLPSWLGMSFIFPDVLHSFVQGREPGQDQGQGASHPPPGVCMSLFLSRPERVPPLPGSTTWIPKGGRAAAAVSRVTAHHGPLPQPPDA